MASSKISALTAYTTPLSSDVFAIVDTANSVTKKVTYSNLSTTLFTSPSIASPTLTTPILGVATATSINKVIITAPATTATLTIVNNATLTVAATATISGTNTGDQTLSDATISTTDITTNNVSTSKHGFVPKAPNDTTKFLRGDATWAVSTLIFKNGTTTKDAADSSTTQNIAHGLGVIPKYVRITAIFQTNNSSFDSLQAYTVYNGTTQSSVATYRSTGGTNTILSSSFILNSGNGAGTNTQTGVVTFDATNIIITWTKGNSPSGVYNLLWEAYG